MLIAILVIVALLVAGVAFFIIGFNKLRTADIAAEGALSGIDVQLTRRADLIPNLVNTVKGYATHERSVFENVTAARARVAEATKGDDVKEKAASEAALDQALVNVMAVAEAYPDLKATENFQQLQAQLTQTEDELAFARRFYNDAAGTLNVLISTIPWMFFAGVASVKTREFYEAPEGQDAPPTVSF